MQSIWSCVNFHCSFFCYLNLRKKVQNLTPQSKKIVFLSNILENAGNNKRMQLKQQQQRKEKLEKFVQSSMTLCLQSLSHFVNNATRRIYTLLRSQLRYHQSTYIIKFKTLYSLLATVNAKEMLYSLNNSCEREEQKRKHSKTTTTTITAATLTSARLQHLAY